MFREVVIWIIQLLVDVFVVILVLGKLYFPCWLFLVSLFNPLFTCRSKDWSTIDEGSVPHANKDDGEFWIGLPDFVKYFSGVTINSMVPDFDMDGCTDSLSEYDGVIIFFRLRCHRSVFGHFSIEV